MKLNVLWGIGFFCVIGLQFTHQAEVDARIAYLENVMQTDLDEFRNTRRLQADECLGMIHHVQELELRHGLAMTHTSWETRLAFRADYYKIKYGITRE